MSECISVIIPAYNASEYLENCLNSVLCQTYQNLEIVVVNDGSTDDTGVIADRYQAEHPERIRVIHKKNSGVTETRFEGVLSSRGDWIGFVDADDEIDLDMYEKLYNYAVQYGADISHCGYKTIVNDGERIHEFYNTGRFANQNQKEGIIDLLEGKFEPSLCNKLFQRKIVVDVILSNKVSPLIKYNEDMLMNYYLFKLAKRSVFKDFCGYHYLARPSSATRKPFREEKVLDPVRVHRQILDDASEEYKSIAIKNYLMACMHAYAALSKRSGYEMNCRELESTLKENRDNWHLLRRNDRIKLQVLMMSPRLYKHLYRIYERYLQKKQYE